MSPTSPPTQRDGERAGGPERPAVGAWNRPRSGALSKASRPARSVRPAWAILEMAIAVQFALGIATLVTVPVGRPSGFLPHKGRIVLEIHAAVGVLLFVGAIALIAAARKDPRTLRIASWVGFAGIVVAGAGGLATANHGARSLGIALMFVGALLAGFAYLTGVLGTEPESVEEEAAARADPP